MPYSALKTDSLHHYVHSLRYRLLRTIALAVFPIAVLSVGQALMRLEAARNDAQVALAQSTQAIAGQEDSVFAESQPLLKALANQPDVLQGGNTCHTALKSALIASPYYLNLSRINADGDVICSALPAATGTTVDDMDWWTDLTATRRFAVSAPVYGKVAKEYVFVAALPLFDEEGIFHGALAAVIPLARITADYRNKHLKQQGVLALIDKSGNVATSNELEHAGKIFADVQLTNDPTRIRYGHDGDGRSWSYCLAPIVANDVYIALAVPTTSLYVWTYIDVCTNILLPFLAAMAAMFAIWFATDRQILRWIVYIGRIARLYSRGRYSVRPTRLIGAPAEFEALGMTLASMAEDIQERDEALRSAVIAKSELIREIHHRVKNHLQIVTSLLRIQTRSFNSPIARDLTEKTVARLSALSLVHSMLQEMEEQPSVHVPGLFAALVEQLHEGLSGDGHDVALTLDIANVTIDPDQASPLVLFAVEIITNAYKHAFPDGRAGTINLSLTPSGEDNTYLLRIEDDGVGLQAGWQEAAKENLGSQLASAFTRQLNGELTIGARENGGTRVDLKFKLNPVTPTDAHAPEDALRTETAGAAGRPAAQ